MELNRLIEAIKHCRIVQDCKGCPLKNNSGTCTAKLDVAAYRQLIQLRAKLNEAEERFARASFAEVAAYHELKQYRDKYGSEGIEPYRRAGEEPWRALYIGDWCELNVYAPPTEHEQSAEDIDEKRLQVDSTQDEKCGDCKYFAELAHNFKVGTGYQKSDCCVFFGIKEKNRWVVETSPDAHCENFEREE